jgi:hypothetical protein
VSWRKEYQSAPNLVDLYTRPCRRESQTYPVFGARVIVTHGGRAKALQNPVKAGTVRAYLSAKLFMEERSMKRTLFIIIVAALAAGALFARGTADGAGMNRGTGNRFDGETVTVSGTVEEADGRVVLKTGDGVYSLSAPGFPRSGTEVPTGQSVEVTGIMNTGNCDDCGIDADGHIFVESASVNGKELVFDAGRGRWNDDGRGQGRWNDDGSNRGGARQGNGQRGGRGNGTPRGGSYGPRFAPQA